MPELDEMKDKAGQAAQNAQNRATQMPGDVQDRLGDDPDHEQQQSDSMMDQAKRRLDANGDDQLDGDDAEDALGKVKGLFKKD